MNLFYRFRTRGERRPPSERPARGGGLPAILLVAVTSVLLGLAPSGLAAQTGSIEGQVRAADGLRPLAGAQIQLVGTERGVLTDASGRFVLPDVPAGARQLRVIMLGYESLDYDVNVPQDGMATADIQLRRRALALDEVVVTGTAGGTQRRALGNVVDRMSAAELAEVTPAQSLTQLIGQRSAGVTMGGDVGQVGTGTRMRIRGVQTMGLPNDPIVYIDGIRMDNNPTSGPGQRGGSRVSRMNDLSPEDIESIEIIKGPAAATLYGTEASNGVVQIITKRGVEGDARVDFTVRTGTNWLWNPSGRLGERCATPPGVDGIPTEDQLVCFNVIDHEEEFGSGPIFQYGLTQNYQANISGGTERFRYFTSGSWQDNEGVLSQNWDRRLNVRTNLDATLTDQLNVQTSVGYVEGRTRLAQGGFNSDPFSNIFWSNPNFIERNGGYFRAPPEEWKKIEDRADVDRFTGSVQLQHNPLAWFRHRLSMGLDNVNERNFSLTPRQPEGTAHFFGGSALGVRSEDRTRVRIWTFDYSGSADFDVNDRLNSVTSAGLQYYRNERESVGSNASNFPAPQITTISAAANRDAYQTFEENSTLGVFIQQQFGWQNRVFVTGAVRADDNSAFGAEFDAAIYPKVSASWVVSEEDFMDLPWVSELRLRGAWGAAGQQPGTFDAVRTLAPEVGFGNQPGLVPSAFGNPDLEPERGEELEIGFDAQLWDGRVSVEYTRFQRSTTSAIVARPLSSSLGFPGSQFVNLGEVSAWGNELALNFRVMEGDWGSWELGSQIATNGNEIDRLGPDQDFVNGPGSTRHYLGYGIGDIYYRTVRQAEIDETGAVTLALCDGGTGPLGVEQGGELVPCSQAPFVRWGPSVPTWDFGVNSTVTFGPIQLYARVDAAGGHYQEDSSSPAAQTSLRLTRQSNLNNNPFMQAYENVGRQPLGTYDASFARLREVSASYTLPGHLSERIGASRARVTVAGRNLAMLWTGEHGFSTPRDGSIDIPIGDGRTWDPEAGATGGSTGISGGFQTVMPPLASMDLTVRLSF
jgi:TonB-dependent SusC/RagA subfamily outer membrane receptor